MDLPLTAAAATAKMTAPLDASHFRKCGPGATYGTIPFTRALSDRTCPPAITGVQKRNKNENRDSLERFPVRAENNGSFFKPLAILAQ